MDDGDVEIFETPDVTPSGSAPAAGTGASGESTQLRERDEELVGESTEDPPVDPAAAFEVFMGRSYLPGIGRSTTTSSTMGPSVSIAPTPTRDGKDRGGKPNQSRETPLQRLYRLQGEVSELATDLRDVQPLVESRKATTRSATSDELDTPDAWTQVHDATSALEDQLRTLRDLTLHWTDRTVLGDQPALHERLRALQDEVRHPSSTASATDAEENEADAPVVVDIYRGAQRSRPSTDAAETLLPDLDARLERLERAVGNLSSTPSRGPLLRRLARLEDSFRLIEPRSMESLGRRAQAVATNLREAARAHAAERKPASSTTTTSGGDGGNEEVDWAALAQRVEEWDAIATDLPRLVRRLRSLHLLHSDAARLSQRVALLESGQERTETQLREDAEAVAALRQALEETITTVASNVEALDDRFQNVR